MQEIDIKILERIENIASDDFMLDMEHKKYLKTEFTQEEAIKMAEKLFLIHKIAHSNNKNHYCYKIHEGWRKL